LNELKKFEKLTNFESPEEIEKIQKNELGRYRSEKYKLF
jgi:hypothetical protein